MNNLFYKSLATLSTLGILVLSTTQILNAIKNSNSSDIEISKTLIELKKARKDALSEVKAFRKNALDDVRTEWKDALAEVKAARSDALRSIKKARGNNGRTWLIMRYGYGHATSLEKAEMANMEQCEFQGAVWEASKRMSESGRQGFECIEGN